MAGKNEKKKIIANLLVGYIVLLVFTFLSISFCTAGLPQYISLCSKMNSAIIGLWFFLVFVSVIVLVLFIIKKKK